VYVPSGSCSWGTAVSWTDKNINLIGANPTIAASDYSWRVRVTGAAGNHQSTAAAFRISGFTQSSGHVLNINSSNPDMTTWAGFYRVDNITYTATGGGNAINVYGPVYGVFDHLNGTASGMNHFEQSMYLNSEFPPSATVVLGETVGRTFAAGLGTQNFVFIEDSTFNCSGSYGSGALSDSESGPQRMVFRHNTVTGTCYHYAHWTRNGEWDGGVMEIYNNNYACTGSGCSGGYFARFQAGTGVAFNNTVTGYGVTSIQIDELRGAGSQTGGIVGECAGSPPGNSQFDVNAGDTNAPGWPCAGQVGTACIAGSCSRSSMNSVPFIIWNNGTQSGCSTGGSCTNSVAFNLDVTGTPRNMANYLKSTAHSLAGPYNGAVDYFSGSAKPSSVGIYTGIGSYAPFTYPYPTTTGGGGGPFALTVTTTHTSVSGPNCSTGSRPSGTVIGPCTATPDTGYSFAPGWSGACSGTGLCGPFPLSSNTSLAATSTINSWLLSTAIGGSGSGTIVCTPAAGSTVNYGTPVSCTITPAAGSTVTSVTGGGGTWTSNPYLFNMPNSAATVTATFALNTYTFAVSTAGTGTGNLTGLNCVNGTYNYLTNISCSATATSGTFVGYTGTGSASGCSGSPCALSIGANSTLQATFSLRAATPTFSPVAGAYGATQNVTISTTTGGATLRYTTSGVDPTCSTGTVYSTPVSVASSLTLKAIACASGYLDSVVGSAAYTINGTAAAPTFSPVAGTYTSVQSVTSSTGTSACASFLYIGTVNPPTSLGNTISVATSETVYSYVHNCPGYSDSTVSSAAYVINLPTVSVSISGTVKISGTVTLQ